MFKIILMLNLLKIYIQLLFFIQSQDLFLLIKLNKNKDFKMIFF